MKVVMQITQHKQPVKEFPPLYLENSDEAHRHDPFFFFFFQFNWSIVDFQCCVFQVYSIVIQL